ncbi:MAG: hypothetical protein JWQ72_997 [Polaromonas sp.]|nr:hypothetical protein [Polaromonas sp.]
MPPLTPHHLASAWSGAPRASQPIRPRLLVAGATGVLGSEVLRRLAGSGRYAHVDVLTREPIATGLARVGMVLTGAGDDCDAWAPLPVPADIGVVMFEPPRLYYDRERALWTPAPQQLPALARWLRRCGVQTLVVVLPHAQGRLPDALKRGLASLDEHAVAAQGFGRVLLVRSAQKPEPVKSAGALRGTAAWMLSTLSYMVPQTEQPVRPSRLAEFVDAALPLLPPGTHVAAPELLWQASQGRAADMHSLVKAWLNTQADGPSAP